jgi:hypothetical protein
VHPTEPMRSDPEHVDAVGTPEGFTERGVAVFVRRASLFLLAIALAYFFVWVPWRSSRPNFLFFLGFGMVQIAAVYTQDLCGSAMAWDAPPLILNPFMSLLVSCLALVGLAIELVIAYASKPWWEFLLLPIPPFIFATYLFRRSNPIPPFVAGVFTLLIALYLKII